MKRRIFHGVGISLVLGATVAQAQPASPTTRPGVRITALDAGLAVAAQVIQDELTATPIKDSPLGPVEGEVAGVKMAIDNVLLDATIATLDLASHVRGLSLKAGLQDVKVAMPVMTVTTMVLGREVTGKCYDAFVRWGRGQPVPLVVEVGATVEDRSIVLTPVAMRHPISPLDYSVTAPSRCDGGAGMRLSVFTALQSAMPLIEPALRRRLGAILPQAAAALTTSLSPTFPISIAGIPGLPSREATLAVSPLSLQTADGRLTLIGGVDVTVSSDVKGRPAVAAAPLASFGINPTILSDAFTRLFPDGTDFIEIDEQTAPGLHDVLDIRSAASIWPDLQHISLSRPYLRLWVRVAAAPQLVADSATQSITADLSGLELKFMIQQDGVWRDYFVMNVGVHAAITMDIAQDALSLHLAPGSDLVATGHWAAGYTPQIDLFEADVAAFLFSTAFDYLSASGPLANVWVPTMVVGGRDVTLANPVVDEPFLSLDLVSCSDLDLSGGRQGIDRR